MSNPYSIQLSASNLTLRHTGANQGVGFEAAKQLALSNPAYHILIGSRSLPRGEAAVASLNKYDLKGTVTPIQLDVTDDASIQAAVDLVEQVHSRLDVLINNAGIVSQNPSPVLALQETLQTNVIGSVAMAEAFLPLLRKSSDPRLIFVSSSVGSLTHASDPSSTYYRAKIPGRTDHYRASKAAVNMLMIEYNKRLTGEGFKVWAADPGLLATNFADAEAVRKAGALEPEVGGKLYASIVNGERDGDVGRVIGTYGTREW